MNRENWISVISTYRDKFDNEFSRPGWNRWALYGAFASLTWVLLGFYQSDNLNYSEAFLLAFAFHLALPLFKQITVSNQRKEKIRYKVLGESIRQNYLAFSLEFLLIIAFGLFVNFKLQLTLLTSCLINPFLGITLLFLISALTNAAKGTLTPINNRAVGKVYRYLKVLVMGIIISSSIAAIIGILLVIWNQLSILIIKSALIWFALYYVLTRLLETFQKNELLDRLDELFDKVVFEELETDHVQNELRIIVLGLESSDIIAPLSEEFVLTINQYQSTLQKAIERTSRVSPEMSIEDVNILQDALAKNIDEMNSNLIQLEEVVSKATRKVIQLQMMENENPNLKEFEGLMRSEIGKSRNQFNDFEKMYQETFNK